jgi:hypothetical protein
VRGNIGRGPGVWPTSIRRVGLICGTRQGPHAWITSTMSAPLRSSDYHSWSWRFPMPKLTKACCLSRTSPNSQSRFGKSCRWLVLFWSACKKHWPPVLVCGTELEMVTTPIASGRPPPPHLSFFFFLLPPPLDGCNIHFNMYLYL